MTLRQKLAKTLRVAMHNSTTCLLLRALRKWAKVYFPLLKGEKHYFIVLVFQNLFFQKSTRVTNCRTAREAELQNKRIFYHPSTAVRAPPSINAEQQYEMGYF